MTSQEALDFLAPAIPRQGETWTDLGAGVGTFTLALAMLLGESGRVIAVDHDPEALLALTRMARRLEPEGRIRPAAGDLSAVHTIAELQGIGLDGALIANALHYLADPQPVLVALSERLKPGARVVVIEYERELSNPYVPYPLPIDRLTGAVEAAGFTKPDVTARRRSMYQGEMYCAVALVAGNDEAG